MGKKSRKSWNMDEVKIARKIFGEHITLKEIPSLPECVIAIKQHSCLQQRSPTQLKAWVNNQIIKGKTKTREAKTNRKGLYAHVHRYLIMKITFSIFQNVGLPMKLKL